MYREDKDFLHIHTRSDSCINLPLAALAKNECPLVLSLIVNFNKSDLPFSVLSQNIGHLPLCFFIGRSVNTIHSCVLLQLLFPLGGGGCRGRRSNLK